MMRVFAALALAGMLGACAQDMGGLTRVDAEFNDQGLPEFTYFSGREAGTLDLDFKKSADGAISVTVNAGELEAFEGQQIQADRIKAQTEAITGALSDILPSLIRDALCAAGIGAECE